MRLTFTIFLFFISIVNLSYGQGSGITNEKFNEADSDKEIDGCTNPKFKAAELAAYQTLLQARAEAARVLTEEITRIEQEKKEKLDKENIDYLKALKTCNTDSCTEAKKIGYDDGVFILLTFAKTELEAAQEKEKTAKEAAKKKYDEEVIEAEKLYCPAYKVSGQNGPIVYSGTICSLEKNFIITGTHPMLDYHFNFAPSSNTEGKFTFSETVGEAVLSGSGTYKVEELSTGKSRIIAQTSSTGKTSVGSSAGSGLAYIDLTPLPSKCRGQ